MPRILHRRLFVVVASVLIVAGVVGLSPLRASAHNTLLSSEPADGASLREPPTQIVWRFDKSVPLDTLTVTLIDATGARRELTGSTHGPTGQTEVVTPLPELPAGSTSLRWRLVGPDGHPITGRIELTVAAVAPTTAATATSVAPATATTTIAPVDDGGAVVAADDDDGEYATPSAARWVLRYASYIAIMAALGILLTALLVWPGATDTVLRRILHHAVLAVAVLAALQLLVVASDVSGDPPWASVGSIDAALSTHAGMALLIRIVLALGMLLVLAHHQLTHPEVYWTSVTLVGLGLLGTWAFAGHARSMRWPELGIATDVAHHAAAAAWIAGLAIVGWIAIPSADQATIVPAVRRLSRVAALSVAVLVGTGILQAWRLVGSPAELLGADHGRYLTVKVAVLAGMLLLANANRRRVGRILDDRTHLDDHLDRLRRAVVIEFAIGLVIVGITAAMVVSPPSTSQAQARAPDHDAAPTVYYTL